ncbi:MAG: PEP-CTERM sorting domain-containing protein [Opitutaceae bacterium]|nr:PEP-CTERM sorting domain-containing protein [Opitutaceae bacterium]
MNSTLHRLLLVSLFLVGALGLRAQTTINFTSQAFEIGKTSTGDTLTDTFVFSLGTFDSFTPTAGNLANWASNFTALGSTTTWETNFTQYSGSSTLSNNNAPFTNGSQGYVWGYNSQSISPTSQWILLTNTSWTFPIAGSTPTINWTSTDIGTVAVFGVINTTSSDPYLQTSAVPEPSTYALLAGLVMFSFVCYRRRVTRA